MCLQVSGSFGQQRPGAGYWGSQSGSQGGGGDAAPYNKPKVITVVRNGPKPRGNVKILLNRRSVQSFEHLTKDISEAFGPKWKANKVRKLFTVKGREVQGVNDFFRDDDVFIAIGNESLTTGDVHDILDELYPDSPYPKTLMKEWEKTKRRYAPSTTSATTGTTAAAGLPKLPEHSDVDEKIDSGLGSDISTRDESERYDDVIYTGRTGDTESVTSSNHQQQRKKKKPVVARGGRGDDDGELVSRLEKERQKAAEEDKER